jgi:16S rRNA A1518/A1519 N6-dimethyltransferase RsmA/KsgA/DIM1 with predicted DNA glycosylase/AP lyase activity
MMTISVHHPEIRTFINIKKNVEKVTGANISIRLTDEFMRAVKAREKFQLRFPVEAYGTPKYLFTVPRGAFRPAPNVDSVVLQVQDIHTLFGNSREEVFFFEVLHAGFGHKRKKLRKNLEAVATPEQVQSAFSACSLDENVRSEDISLPVWRALVEILWKEKNA